MKPITECIAFDHILSFSDDVITSLQPALSEEQYGGVSLYSASFFKDISFIYVHCVSKDDFCVHVSGLEEVEVIFRMIHISFPDKFDERRVALVPTSIDNCSMDFLFNSRQSPALIRLISTSNIRASYRFVIFLVVCVLSA